MNKTLSKGFTLIELLVVIAILGILAAVVLVAINPAQRIAEASDSGVKSNVSQVATAVESCYTSSTGNYASCDTAAELTSGGYLKNFPSGGPKTCTTGGAFAASGGSTQCVVSIVTGTSDLVLYEQLQNQNATCDTTTSTGVRTYVYRTSTGNSKLECLAAAPTVATVPAYN